MHYGSSLYLLKLVPRIIIQAALLCCLFISKLQITQSQHLQEQCQKNGGVGYNFPPFNFAMLYQELSLRFFPVYKVHHSPLSVNGF